MQDLPDKTSLVEAVARLLSDERLKKEVRDPALAFRLKIATHVLETVAREHKLAPAHDASELTRLEALLGPGEGTTTEAKIVELNRTLAKRLRAGDEPQAFLARAHAHLKQTLIEKLAVTQPRFDTSREIE